MDQYGQVQEWFKTIEDRADGNQRRNDFTVWCDYGGIFAITALYFTCSYPQCARDISFVLPFREVRAASRMAAEWRQRDPVADREPSRRTCDVLRSKGT